MDVPCKEIYKILSKLSFEVIKLPFFVLKKLSSLPLSFLLFEHLLCLILLCFLKLLYRVFNRRISNFDSVLQIAQYLLREAIISTQKTHVQRQQETKEKKWQN